MSEPRPLPKSALAWGASLTLLAFASGAEAQATVSPDDFAKLQAQVQEQARRISDQQAEIEKLRAENVQVLSAVRGSARPRPQVVVGAGPGFAMLQEPVQSGQAAPNGGPPTRPVGEAPPPIPPREVAAIPPQVGVLTPKGRFVLDPAIEYNRTSNDRIVFRGVVLVPGINLGLVEASQAERDLGVASITGYYGVTDRLEVEARVPYVYRHDTVTTVAAQANQFQQSDSLYGHGIGDVELAARYQLNYGANGLPIFLASARLKTRTGRGPYDVPYDNDAVALELPTGSGFMGLEGGVVMLYPTDPAIIYGSLTYLHNFSRDVNKTFGSGQGGLRVGKVDPGDSIGATLGFGLSLNPRFSFSFGYEHNYVFETTSLQSTPGNTPITVRFRPLQAGSIVMGGSFRLSDKLTLNSAVEWGVTSDAPDLQLTFRVPYRF